MQVQMHKCDNCGKLWKDDELNYIRDYHERVEGGGIAPSGECPDSDECGALCYPIGGYVERLEEANEALLRELKHMVAVYWGKEGDGGEPPSCIVSARAAIAKAEGQDNG